MKCGIKSEFDGDKLAVDLPARKVSSTYGFDAIPKSALFFSSCVTFSDSVDLSVTDE